MLKKGEHFLSNLNGTKKNKLLTEPNQSYSISNKQNIFSKSLFENINDSQSNLYSNNNKFQQSGFGSTLISPTFQSPDLVNLKDDRFKQGKQQEKTFVNLNFSLKDMEKPSKDAQKVQKSIEISKSQFQDQYFAKISELDELKKKLIEHYSKKKYWKKIEDLFQKEGVDAVLAWQDAIEKYKTVKNANEALNQQKQKLSSDLQQKNEIISQLQKQILQDKNETKVLSQKKCKGCQHLQLKQKEYHQIYEQNKRNLKQIQELKESCGISSEQTKRIDDKYKNLVFVKEQLQKKNGKLIQKQRQLLSIIQKMQKAAQQDCSNSKDLYIQIEQLKEAKYQLQRGAVKIDQKYKREIANLTIELNGSEDEKNILLSQSEKLKQELNQLKSKLLKQQFQLQAKGESTLLKNIQCQDLKKRHIQTLSQQIRKRNGLQEQLKSKDEELKKSYLLIDEIQDIKIKFQQELNQMKKSYFVKDEELSKLTETIRNLQQKLKEFQQSETRIRQGQNNSVKSKNLTIGNFQGNFQTNSPQSNTLLARVSSKIRQIYLSVMQLNQDNQEGYQRRRPREDLSEERQQINLLKTQKQLNQINSQLFTFKNKFDFILKENENLKIQLENQVCYKQHEAEQLQREIQLKEEALKTLTCYVPQDLKGIVTDFLYLAEELVKLEDPSDTDLEDYDNLRQTVQQQGLEWRDQSQKELRRARKLQQQLRKLEEENGQLKRRAKMRDPKKINYTDYDTREVGKKDIRKKYNLEN